MALEWKRIPAPPGTFAKIVPGLEVSRDVALVFASTPGSGEQGEDKHEATMYVERYTPAILTHTRPIILIHGDYHSHKLWLVKPDGGPGWVEYFTDQGYQVYIMELPLRFPDAVPISGAMSVERVETQLTALAVTHARGGQTFWPGAANHDKWPGTGLGGDPILQNYVDNMITPLVGDRAWRQRWAAAGINALLLSIQPSVLGPKTQRAYLIGEGTGASIAWMIADGAPAFVSGVIAVEPVGPPCGILELKTCATGRRFMLNFASGHRKFGLTDSPLTYDPPVDDTDELAREFLQTCFLSKTSAEAGGIVGPPENPTNGESAALASTKVGKSSSVKAAKVTKRQLVHLKMMNHVVITGPCSSHSETDWATVRFLGMMGVPTEWILLKQRGIHGNGHLMFLETNSDQIAGEICKWIQNQEDRLGGYTLSDFIRISPESSATSGHPSDAEAHDGCIEPWKLENRCQPANGFFGQPLIYEKDAFVGLSPSPAKIFQPLPRSGEVATVEDSHKISLNHEDQLTDNPSTDSQLANSQQAIGSASTPHHVGPASDGSRPPQHRRIMPQSSTNTHPSVEVQAHSAAASSVSVADVKPTPKNGISSPRRKTAIRPVRAASSSRKRPSQSATEEDLTEDVVTAASLDEKTIKKETPKRQPVRSAKRPKVEAQEPEPKEGLPRRNPATLWDLSTLPNGSEQVLDSYLTGNMEVSGVNKWISLTRMLASQQQQADRRNQEAAPTFSSHVAVPSTSLEPNVAAHQGQQLGVGLAYQSQGQADIGEQMPQQDEGAQQPLYPTLPNPDHPYKEYLMYNFQYIEPNNGQGVQTSNTNPQHAPSFAGAEVPLPAAMPMPTPSLHGAQTQMPQIIYTHQAPVLNSVTQSQMMRAQQLCQMHDNLNTGRPIYSAPHVPSPQQIPNSAIAYNSQMHQMGQHEHLNHGTSFAPSQRIHMIQTTPNHTTPNRRAYYINDEMDTPQTGQMQHEVHLNHGPQGYFGEPTLPFLPSDTLPQGGQWPESIPQLPAMPPLNSVNE